MAGSRLGVLLRVVAAIAVCVAAASVASAQDMLPILPLPEPPAAQPAQVATADADPQATAAEAAAATPASVPAQPAAPKQTQAQLDQLLAPVALYPDPLLGQVLMASTYPLEVVEAARWVDVRANRALTGDALTTALNAQHWDPSVMALVPFPHLLATMSQKIEWTQALGNAFLAQQADVMAAVQRLRHDAMVAGNLNTSAGCHCAVKTSGQTISIASAEPQVVYVPIYTPIVYGPWPDPAYPPFAFPLPIGFVFGPGVPIGYGPAIELALYGPLWGWGWIDWPHGRIAVDPARYALVAHGHPPFPGGVWMHDPAHRGLVAYSSPAYRPATVRAAAAIIAPRLAVLRRMRPPRFAARAATRIVRPAIARPVFHRAPFGFRPGQILPSPEHVAALRFGGPIRVASGFGPRGPDPAYRRR
jgi:hypothetical protein